MIVLLFGPPGCGKGTQAGFISSHFHVPAISTGEMFRAECSAGTNLGKLACSVLARGGLVGDDIVNQMVEKRTSQADCASGFLLDGYPRTLPQAVFLERLLRKRTLPRPLVIHLDVPPATLVSRLSARRQCPACLKIYNMLSNPPRVSERCDVDGTALVRREDDTEPVILRRLKAYKELTGPVLQYYADKGYFRVDAARGCDEVWGQIQQILSAEVPARARHFATAATRPSIR